MYHFSPQRENVEKQVLRGHLMVLLCLFFNSSIYSLLGRRLLSLCFYIRNSIDPYTRERRVEPSKRGYSHTT